EQNQLNWRADRIWVGHNATAEVWHASFLPFDVTFQALGDIIVVGIYGFFLGLQIFIFSWWQKRGRAKPPAELPTSTFGPPLVRKGGDCPNRPHPADAGVERPVPARRGRRRLPQQGGQTEAVHP